MLIICIVAVFLFFLFSYFYNSELISDELIKEYYEEEDKVIINKKIQ